MEQPPEPPGYTSTDTSNVQAKKIPLFVLEPPLLAPIKTEFRKTTFQTKDCSGNYVK
jgi:hypothetical protein